MHALPCSSTAFTSTTLKLTWWPGWYGNELFSSYECLTHTRLWSGSCWRHTRFAAGEVAPSAVMEAERAPTGRCPACSSARPLSQTEFTWTGGPVCDSSAGTAVASCVADASHARAKSCGREIHSNCDVSVIISLQCCQIPSFDGTTWDLRIILETAIFGNVAAKRPRKCNTCGFGIFRQHCSYCP